jgi:hypothetical protein
LAKFSTLFRCLSQISLKSLQICTSAQTWYQAHFKEVLIGFQADPTCLTINKVKPQLFPNSAPFCHSVSVVNNLALLFFHPSHFHCTNNKFKPFIKGIKIKILTKDKKCSILSPCKMLLTSLSKHFVQILCGKVTGGGG